MTLWATDWGSVFGLSTPLAEIFVRGTITYLVIFVLLRFVLSREAGQLALSDILVLVLIADAAQNAMAGTYSSITDGLALVAVIVGWATFLDWLSFRVPLVERFLKPQPKVLVRHGHAEDGNLSSELMTMEELMTQLRLQGIDDLSKVKVAYMESDGRVSVIPEPGDEPEGGGRAPDRPMS